MTKRLLVMAGGTGGHIFPGIAVAQALQKEGWKIHWLGTAARMEAQLVPKAGYDISFIDVAGVRGNGVLRLMAAPFHILKAIWQAMSVIRKFKPNVVLGMGGFAAGPGGIAAWLLNVPVVIHEQNAVPGVTNKILSRVAKRLLVGFQQSFSGNAKAKWVGNPVRKEFSEVGELQSVVPCKEGHEEDQGNESTLHILVVGGSLGAQCLNQYVPDTLKALQTEQLLKGVVVHHQCGKGNQEQVSTHYRESVADACEWQVMDFIDDMVSAYQWANIIICRAGALTVSEVAAAGRCAIFVPLPHAVDDHQTLNARSLVDHQAGLLLPQSELQAGKLIEMLKDLISMPEQVVELAKKAKSLAKTDATEQVARVCVELSEVGA